MYIEFSEAVKMKKFQVKIFDIFLAFAQNIDICYTQDLSRRGGSIKDPHSIFWIKNKKIRYTPVNPSFTI